MVFSSLEFIFRFLPIFLILYYFTPNKYRNITLFIGSLCFYAFGEPIYILLILFSLLINFLIGIKLSRLPNHPHQRQFIFILSLLFNFGMLFFFKYTNFLIENINPLLSQIDTYFQLGLGKVPFIPITLPLGISFYTFQIVSYVVDVYTGKQKSEKSFLNLGIYLCMFPQLIAGPIVIYSEIAESIKSRTYSLEAFENGLKTFIIGLGSKILIANRIGTLWNDIQTIGFESISTPLAWMGAFAFSLQIYFDFNGYSLMAIGLGEMLGFKIPRNFNKPYLAHSISDFWKRWHITLGRFFLNYVYIPLGGNRKGIFRTIVNLFLVWSLTGFWHGASWNFVLWGITFFILLTIEKLFLHKVFDKVKILGHLYVIFLIPLTWVIFAITNLNDLLIYFDRLFPWLPGVQKGVVIKFDYVMHWHNYGPLFIIAVILCTPFPSRIYDNHKKNFISILVIFSIFWLSVYQLANAINNPFLYFRF